MLKLLGSLIAKTKIRISPELKIMGEKPTKKPSKPLTAEQEAELIKKYEGPLKHY